MQDKTAGYNNTAIVVLTDLSKTGLVELSAIVDGNPIEKSITIKGDGATVPTLTRIAPVEGDSDKNDRVLKVSGGAKIKFENIIINGITDESYYHGALAIGEAAVSEELEPPISRVTLGKGAVITGKKDGITGYAYPAESNAGSGVFTGLYGELVMETGSKVTGCETSGGDYALATVTVAGGTFTMTGGEISGNTLTSTTVYGGGVYVGSYIIQPTAAPPLYFPGEFTMTGGEISGNSITVSGYNPNGNHAHGGGVYVSGDTNQSAEEGFKNVFVKFTMKGGKISGNTLTGAGGELSGGGVYVGNNGIFDMSDSEISSNDAGSGVYVNMGGEFNMKNSRISDNKNGSGVYVRRDSNPSSTKFNMIDSEISGNVGPGVYLDGAHYNPNAKFTMESGIIYGNSTDNGTKINTDGSLVVQPPDSDRIVYTTNITQYHPLPD